MSKAFIMAILLLIGFSFAWDSCRVPLPNYTIFDATFGIATAGSETLCSEYSFENNVLVAPSNIDYLTSYSTDKTIYCYRAAWQSPQSCSDSFIYSTNISLPRTTAEFNFSITSQAACASAYNPQIVCGYGYGISSTALTVSNGTDNMTISSSCSVGYSPCSNSISLVTSFNYSSGVWTLTNGSLSLTTTNQNGINITSSGSVSVLATYDGYYGTSAFSAQSSSTIKWNLYTLVSNFTQPACSNVTNLVGDDGTCFQDANTILYNTKGFSSYFPSANASTYCKAILYSGTDVVFPLITYSPANFAYSSFYNSSSGAVYLKNNSVHYIYDIISNRWFLSPALTCSNTTTINTVQAYALTSASTGEEATKLTQIVVVSNIFKPLSNVSVLINQFTPSTNTTTSLGLFTTDSYGMVTQMLPVATSLFVFSVYDNSGLLQAFSAVAIPCSSSELVCKLILVVNPNQEAGYINTFGTTSGSCNWDNTTGFLNCTSIGSNISRTTLTVFHNNATEYTQICNNYINSAGEVSCSIDLSTPTCYNILMNTTYSDGERRVLVNGEICTYERASMGVVGIFAAFLLVCAFTGMGVYFGAPGALIGMVSGLTMAALLGMVPPVMFPMVVVMDIVLGGIAAYLVRGA